MPYPSRHFKPVVVAPTFNNARTLGSILDGMARAGVPIIAVNDGSTDQTAELLSRWAGWAGGAPAEFEGSRIVLTHCRNMGKATALQTGFSHALSLGFTHAATIDTDGQLDPAQIPEMLQVAEENPRALVVGCRDAAAVDCPRLSRLGRWASNLLVRWQSGARVKDSQCGFRVYPLRLISLLHASARRFGFETEILTHAAWAGIDIVQPAVRCTYDMPEGRVSHFRPWRDSLAGARMHIRLLLRAFFPWPGVRLNKAASTGGVWRRFSRWISPVRAWRALRCDPRERPRFAAGVAAGVFIANLPLYGIQTLVSLYAARRLRLNPLPVVIGSYLSTPPMGPLLIALAIALGHWMTHGTLQGISSFDPRVIGYTQLLRSVLLDWIIGGLACGAVLGACAFVLMRLILRWVPSHTARAQEVDPGEPALTPAHAAAESAA